MVTPSANRNSYRVAKMVRDDTQGRGAAHLNPGLGNRNSYRVAFGCVLAHIISTHSKDRGSQWPKLWAGKSQLLLSCLRVRIGSYNLYS